ncbi:hypothetical protein [Polyangium mundeleinium]|uniref:Uncharacterized protein n=1 Tax=Polyangium mundeleinium TaxID=2995306 RepID=A0ABT5ET80_9BACT|nr:hypothetical protein [Polyangium mundeleinium]MDC0745028.1 hypothetical protein [Polyangium mundeleinium]
MLLTDARFDLPPDLPFAPGASPFRQKGHVYRGNHDFMNKRVPGGLAALRQSLPTPELGKFFEQRFEVSAWYDSLPNIYLQDAAARVRGVPFEEHARELGVWHARERLKGFYSVLLRAVSTESVAVWAPRVPSMYYSFGKFQTRIVAPRRVSLAVRGVPVILARWLGAIMAAAGGEMVLMAGARDLHCEFPSAEPDGTAYGVPVCRLEGEVTWR